MGDFVKAKSIESTQLSLMPADMGWWGWNVYSAGSYYASTPDELEYMASRAAGWGTNVNLETSARSMSENQRTLEALSRVRSWLRLDLPENVRQKLRGVGTDFLLVRRGEGSGGGGMTWWI